jgi:hypothetical protein
LKADDSLRSFLFTLKNPHNIPARRFALNAEKRDEAIACDSNRGPDFDGLVVSDSRNANTRSCTWLGNVYANDTELDGSTVFTGSWNFQAKKIEVVDITE